MRRAWYQVGTTGHFGYPQPEDDYHGATYEAFCLRCGVHGRQRAPLRVRTEPTQKRSQFIALHWVYDALFVRPDVVDAFRGAGITGATFGPVVRHRTGEPLGGWTQLQVAHVLPLALDREGVQPVTCRPENEEANAVGDWTPAKRYPRDYPYGGAPKYHFPKRPQFAAAAFAGAPDVAYSAEWFGSGGVASRMVLFSERVIDLVEGHRWRGLWAHEVALVESGEAQFRASDV